ncbi:MAG TPA: methionine--tRNA ligase [Candidatus Thalassarchaeaceae archaeon]|nr:methionine--tRNA ligase [Candidatus Thalassarchaeaceae archaeon]
MEEPEHVLICVAWPYANGPLHLGHVAGCYLPPDIQLRFERALGNRVLLVSGSDEHGTPITVTAEQQGVEPQEIVDKFHAINKQALLDLGCAWEPNIDPRGIEFGGALFNRTSDPRHKELVQENFLALLDAGMFEQKTMQQYYELREDGGGRFLPDRYIEGTCPSCGFDAARGDQCDECGTTYETSELTSPRSKMNPETEIEVRDTEHFFFRLDLFQKSLELHAEDNWPVWKTNVRSMTKNWLDMGLRPRAVTRDLDWGIQLPLSGDEWVGKCVYVWFEAVQGYYTCARIWSAEHAISSHPDGEDAWMKWWKNSENGPQPRHLYFLGKDNIPFHTVIWPSIIMALNHTDSEISKDDDLRPRPGDLHLEDNVPAMEYLMLSGGQFSKSRKHAVWLPSFLERFDPDTLRYYLSINMPENHDTDFNWPDFVEKINNELIGTYGNFVHRVMTLAERLDEGTGNNPLQTYDDVSVQGTLISKIDKFHDDITSSLQRHRYKEALRSAMNIAQLGNQMLQEATPWKFLSAPTDVDEQWEEARNQSLGKLAFAWRIVRCLSIVTQPFLPFSSQRLWENLGESGNVALLGWSEALNWNSEMTWVDQPPSPLFTKLDLDEIIAHETLLAGDKTTQDSNDPTHGVKGGKKTETEAMTEAPEGTTYLNFETFMEVEIRTGTITEVRDHPDADKLYVVSIDDGTEEGRTVCAGLKPYYSIDEMNGKSVVFVANLEPRKLRGVMSEGMLLAADDSNGNVRLISIDGDIANGSLVR